MKIAASLSILSGLPLSWGSIFYGKFSGQESWVYLAPLNTIMGSTLVFVLVLLSSYYNCAFKNRAST